MQLEKAKELEEMWKNERPYSGGKEIIIIGIRNVAAGSIKFIDKNLKPFRCAKRVIWENVQSKRAVEFRSAERRSSWNAVWRSE